MSSASLFDEHWELHALYTAGGADETAIDDFVREADRFEDLRAFVGLQRRDAHLRHNFKHAFGDALLIAVNERLFAFGIARYQAFLARLPE